jgi:hypothetical protein
VSGPNARFISSFAAVHFLAAGIARELWSFGTGEDNDTTERVFDRIQGGQLGRVLASSTVNLVNKASAGELVCFGRPNFERRAGAIVELELGRVIEGEFDLHEPLPPGAWLTGQLWLSHNNLTLRRAGVGRGPMTLYSDLRFDLERLMDFRDLEGVDTSWWPLAGENAQRWCVSAKAEKEALRRLDAAGHPKPGNGAWDSVLNEMWQEAGRKALKPGTFTRYRNIP